MHSRVTVPGVVEVVADSGGQQDTRVLFVYSISIPHIDLAKIFTCGSVTIEQNR